METKVLLRLIKDDIKLLDEINGSFIRSEMLTTDEVEVALVRAKSLVMEFEMLSKNITQLHDIKAEPEVKVISAVGEKVGPKLKAMPVFIDESELMDLQEEAVLIPVIDKTVQNHNIEEIPEAEKVTQKVKVVKGQKSEEPVAVSVNEGLFVADKVADKKIHGEILGDKHQSVNDLLSQERIENNFEGIPLKSIRDGIGMNDRFLFMRELFANSQEKYENTITTLDGFTKIGEAVEYLKLNYKWNKTEAGQKFLSLVKRRFTK